jgi:YD repeat-containing protein
MSFCFMISLLLSTSNVVVASEPAAVANVLSASPSVADIQSLRLFSEPLIPVGHQPSLVENQRLGAALASFQQRPASDDFSALEQFLAGNPESAWAPALWLNLSAEYYNSGWYSKALRAWETSWSLLKTAAEPEVKPLADQAAGELAYLYARLGRRSELEAHLDSVQGRAFVGAATERISGARQGLWTMRNQPEIAFRCGPLALGQILMQQNAGSSALQIIHEAKSTTNGCSLTEVAELSHRVGLNYQLAFRSNGAAILMPAVVNWKAGHYAALIREEAGLYLLQDPTFGNDSWLSHRAFEAEASGYFLIPSGPLPPGWRGVSEAEGETVFGKGITSTSDPDSTTDEDSKAGCDQPMPYAGIRGMARASVHLMVVSLNIQDIPVGCAPPVGPPVFFRATYGQREANQPALFGYSNLGPKWTFNWFSCIKDNPATPSANVAHFTTAGGALPFSGFNSTNQTFAPQVKDQSILKRTSSSSYELSFRSGAKIIFALPQGAGSARRVLMTQMIDPQGNTVNIGYDGSFRVVGVTNAIGQVTTFSYDHPSDTLKITKVTDPYGRFATFNYDLSGRLTQITDVIGLSSQFTYDAGDFIRELITPYGTNSFEKGEVGRQRWLVTTHPNGEQERVEYNENYAATAVPVSDSTATVPSGMAVYNGYLGYRNSFHWDRKAYAEAPADYNKARLYHWVHMGNNAGGILESERKPFENRVWYSYDGQSAPYAYGTTDQPNAIGRVLEDGSTQLTRFSYDAVGNLTNSIDPVGRSVTYVYDTNLVDLREQ